MTSRLLTLTDLVERLHALDGAAVDTQTVTAILAEGTLDEHSLRPYIAYRDDKYARHLVRRSALFDVAVLCWRPGQRTPIHNHNGQLGWVRLIRGRMHEDTYALPGGAAVPDLSQVEIDDEGVGHNVSVDPTGRMVLEDAGTVTAVDRMHAIHRLGNPIEHPDDEPAVTLHVYSRPHDSCLVFEPGTRTCRRLRLVYDSTPSEDDPAASAAT